MKNYFLVITLLTLSIQSYAGSWLQADLQYIQQINGKNYTAKVTLLRPESYFTENKVESAGDKLTVNLPEMGLDNVAMKVISLKPFEGIKVKESNTLSYRQIDEVNWDNKPNRPVTATFARYADEVYTYKFKDSKTGEISTINATPNHPFYVLNKHDYVQISKVTADDELLSAAGKEVKLLCNETQVNCGVRFNKDNKPALVYNFEVYQQHRYFVADENKKTILVHNGCLSPEKMAWLEKYTSSRVFPGEKSIVVIVQHNFDFSARYPDGELYFGMTFSPDTWEFNNTFRTGFNDVHANDITHYMYLKAMEIKPSFNISQPKYFVRSAIINQETRALISQNHGDSDFLEKFLTKTPNGKHSKRVADDMGFKFTGIEIEQEASDDFPTAKLILGSP